MQAINSVILEDVSKEEKLGGMLSKTSADNLVAPVE